ncbi:MAG: CDP-diacylglycerol--glycerol-3-phosphate 3-phosphatidyltransferase [Candidatus Theseobacter exili]|nr:CDP-diacylglycerol--glycerol-3-phosphate 3-phosphatidyltransferase [Candidatus Theseobacter exili]
MINLANRITIFRILLIPVFIVFMIYYRKSPSATDAWWYLYCAIITFIFAVISDAADGYIARRKGQKTKLGTILDPLADKLLLTSAVVVMALPSRTGVYALPYWYAVLVISRDIIIVAGSFIVHMLKGAIRIKPSIMGKITTFLQMMTVCWVLFKLPYPQVFVYCSSAFTVFSGLGYIIAGNKQINEGSTSR